MFFTGKGKEPAGTVDYSSWIHPILSEDQRKRVNDLIITMKSELLEIMIDISKMDDGALDRVADLIRKIDKEGMF